MSLFLIITILFFHPPTFTFAQNHPQYQNCSALFHCGNISNIVYPFWGAGRPQYCGHPNFGLNCTAQTATITLADELTYQVLEIQSESTSLQVVRTDYIDGVCPSRLANTSLDTANFDFGPEIRNIDLYYDCSNQTFGFPTIDGLSTEFTCNTPGNEGKGFYTTRDLGTLGNAIASYLGSCATKVIVTATKSAVDTLEGRNDLSVANLEIALEQGFGLEYKGNHDSTCGTCELSGGKCGSNSTDPNLFACYCTDRPYPFSCGGSSENGAGGNSSKAPIAIGLSVAGVAVVVGIGLGVWFLLFVQRRKRASSPTSSKDLLTPPSSKSQSAPVTNFSQTIPSYPSSKSDLEKGSLYFGTQVFSYDELVEATDNFDPSRELGDGGFGTVYYGVLNDGRIVAVKRLFENNIKRAEQFMNEIEILTRLRHKNLVALYGCTSKRSRELVLVYEYISNGTVADHLHGNRTKSSLLPWKVRLSIAIETADALAYLHASDVIHRDVKTNNILLDSNFSVKVADFGLSRLFPNDVSHVSTAPQGTPGYVDPEYYQCYQLTDKSDVYSFGVVLTELLSSLQAVDTSRHRLDINLANMAVSKIQNHAINELVDPMLGFEKDYLVRKMTTSVAELAFRCLQQEKDMRPTMAEVLQALKKIESEDFGSEKVEVLDIKDDDAVLLNHVAPFSPDDESIPTDKWGKQMKTL
ncbi:LEAF RUST 10 DISEASE-RESISTANCE LOCUS RECEPTOR-LIKE PROTEIN KINASE-like 1.3 isoform X2 [Mercurialis annua]|uniref:LEAF RUST 10 DISEASE-RESISTANCE LOCUS RECEPTOR-LIKE PROTEIN KINASE-like 1.3 isoform X2 n=1 Tax=Mercurialis annua TaxID=3986 RepID=UPI002160D7BF|nr:LEAF RUST 10 DISEASE-RESISTANCE LOCUS RECEPTOR-LIKE PROTEIN KINASE-like 1.3 isoform X2 [Mercurialis annua]